jgi:hypothetical protein
MDSFALGYLAQRFAYRIGDFLRHWYVKSVRVYGGWVLDVFTDIDYTLAWRITAKNLFQPLYRDFSIIGYLFGFLFRGGRLIIGSCAYMMLGALALAAYLAWLLLPPFLLYKVFFG